MMQVISKLLSRHASFVACAVSAAMLSVSAPARGDAITITQWDPGVLVDSPVGYDDDGWTTVENPSHRTISAQVGNSVSSSTIDFAWAGQFGTFLIQSQQVAAGHSAGTVRTSAPGYIRLTVAEPLPLHIDAAWTYALPADFMLTQFGLGIGGDSSQTVLFRQTYSRVTLPGEPSSGTLPIQGDVVLLPGETWRIQYWMNLEADAGPNFSATGNGFVNFTISPEGSTLALLAPLLLVVSRRALRCRRAPSP